MLDYSDYYREFSAIAKANDWQRLHSPRNLATAVLQESAELCAEFQWLTDQESRALDQMTLSRVGSEVADVALYLFALCESLGLDLDSVIAQKQAVLRDRLNYSGSSS